MTNLSAHDVFWLARYAHNKLAPLIKTAQQYEPSIFLKVEMNFTDGHRVYKEASLGIMAHWDRASLLIYSPHLKTKEHVDAVASTVQHFIDTEQAALELAADLASEQAEDAEAFKNMTPITIVDPALYDLLAADAAADADFEFQQERARDRADIEHDQDAHDIDLQNEYAGN